MKHQIDISGRWPVLRFITTLLCIVFLQLFFAAEALAQTPVPYMEDPLLSPEVKQFLKGLNTGGRPLETLPPLQARKVLSDAQASVKVDLSGIDVTQKTITADGYTVPLYIVKPAGHKGVLPVIVFIHGGGWLLGDFPTHKRMVRDLVVLTGAAAVFIDYTRTPDAAYPRAINEIYAATKWVAENGSQLGVDGKRLAIVGNSVGGNMTTVTVLKAKLMGGPAIRFWVLFWPIVDADFETASYRQFGQDRFLTTSAMKWLYDMYIPDPQKRKDIYASPLRASLEQLRGLPPVLIQVAENDVLRDEGEAFGRKLAEAGVRTATVRYNGVIHDFGLLNGLADIPQTHALFLHAASELKKFLR